MNAEYISYESLIAARDAAEWGFWSMIGAWVSAMATLTAAIVGFGGIAGKYGMGILWLAWLNVIVGIFIAFAFLGKRTRRIGHNLGSVTFPEFLGRRFNSRFIQVASGLIIFCGMPLYAAVVLIGAARFMETSLALNFSLSLLILSLIIAKIGSKKEEWKRWMALLILASATNFGAL